ncbi:MAG: SDR family oxidoreductase [Candidatus Eisenbacteria sp.]|nr:SDR family oxidoreductase [Candidatus Eisenbacteria bacterium]
MKLLVLGGTVFLGRHLVGAALVSGHEVTLFNRGQHNPSAFPKLEKLRGDRNGNLEALRGRRWDAVIDTCGYLPRVVRASGKLLADATDHYTFISSLSVYSDLSSLQIDESTPVGTLEDETVEEITGETYGPLKALCEQAAEEALPGRVLSIRPGLIVGPHDPSDRFTYWPRRVAQGGEVLAPGRPEREIQFIDVRDLAEWTLRMIEGHHTGTYNATGPERPLTMLAFLEACRTASASDARFVWVDQWMLKEEGIEPYTTMPLWIPDAHDTVNCSKAFQEGLMFRLLEETIQDTLAWDTTRPADTEHQAGLSPERESQVLESWHQKA